MLSKLMPANILLIVLLVLVALALGLIWLVQRQHRQLHEVDELSQQVQRIAVGGTLRARVQVDSAQPRLATLGTAVNHLLTRASAPPPPPPPPPAAALANLGDRVHQTVLLHSADAIVYANSQFAALVGAQAADLVGRKLADIVPPEYAELVGENIRKRLEGEATAERYEIELLGLQGQSSRLELSSWPVEHEGATVLMIVGVEILPTQQLAVLAGPDSGVRSRSRAALEVLPEPVITTDLRGRVDYLNGAASRLLGLNGELRKGGELGELLSAFSEEDRRLLSDPVRQALSAGAAVNLGRRALTVAQAGGGERLVEIAAAPMRDELGEVNGAVLILHDVTEARGITRQMSYQATHDGLTGLVNRREFEHRLQDAIEIAKRGDATNVLCYVDLDRFKLINDTSGHLAGDSLLRDVAKMLREAVRDSDTVARLGGDEFGLLLSGCPLDKARQIADDVCRRIADYRFVWKDKIFNIGASVGIVELARDSGTVDEALAAADSACYVAKRQGGHVAVYSARDEALARQSGEIQWLQILQSALKENRFELYCQSIIPAAGANGDGPAKEVLVRLKNEAGEPIAPQEFIRAAERYRLMGTLDRRIVQTTLTALGSGALGLPAGRSIAINISGQTLADAQFLEFVVECFDTTGAAPAQVCFEISENAVIGNLDQARRFIGVLHGMGCRFALDDFGSGLGSFSNLKNLSVDYLKIDGAFTRNLARDQVTQTMVTAMIKLARTMNFKVIAEQVEDEDSAAAARKAGVDFLQGYAISMPEPLALAA